MTKTSTEQTSQADYLQQIDKRAAEDRINGYLTIVYGDIVAVEQIAYGQSGKYKDWRHEVRIVLYRRGAGPRQGGNWTITPILINREKAREIARLFVGEWQHELKNGTGTMPLGKTTLTLLIPENDPHGLTGTEIITGKDGELEMVANCWRVRIERPYSD